MRSALQHGGQPVRDHQGGAAASAAPAPPAPAARSRRPARWWPRRAAGRPDRAGWRGRWRTRWRWPPERRTPFSPRKVSKPCGRRRGTRRGRGLGGGQHLGVARPRSGRSGCCERVGGEDHRLLRHQADAGAQIARIECRRSHAVDQERPAAGRRSASAAGRRWSCRRPRGRPGPGSRRAARRGRTRAAPAARAAPDRRRSRPRSARAARRLWQRVRVRRRRDRPGARPAARTAAPWRPPPAAGRPTTSERPPAAPATTVAIEHEADELAGADAPAITSCPPIQSTTRSPRRPA